MINGRQVFLKEVSGNIRLKPLKQEVFNIMEWNYNIMVDSQQDKTQYQNQFRYYTLQERDTQFIVGFKRAAYEHGDELPYDGRENYINKISYLAVNSNMDSRMVRKLLARAMLDMNDEHLILVSTKEDKAVKVFESLNFTRISFIQNSLKQYVFSFKNNHCLPKKVSKPGHLSRNTYSARLPENERRYPAFSKGQDEQKTLAVSSVNCPSICYK